MPPLLQRLFAKPRGYAASVDQLRGEIWVVQGPRLGEKWSLDEGDLKVGRISGEGVPEDRFLVFPDHCRLISGKHAVFQKDAEGYWVADLGSKNGTAVNGRRIDEKTKLMDGDEIDIGQVVFRVKIKAPSRPPPRCTLAVVSGTRQGESWVLEDAEFLVGRCLEGDHVISFPETDIDISAEHAVFRRAKHSFWVVDRGSRNGTFVNGRRVESAELKNGDRVAVGAVVFEARITG